MYTLKSESDEARLIELLYQLNQEESARIALYRSLAAANNINLIADFSNFSFLISAVLPIDSIAANTPIFPEWNASVMYPFYSILLFKDIQIKGGSFQIEVIPPTSGAFISTLFLADKNKNFIQDIFIESDSNDGSVSPTTATLNLDINFAPYFLALGIKGAAKQGQRIIWSDENNFRFDGIENGYLFSIEDGGDTNFLDWKIRISPNGFIYQPLLIPEAILLTAQRISFADPFQAFQATIDAENLKINFEGAISFLENWTHPLKILA